VAFLDRFDQCANFDPTGYLPFVVDGARVGLMRPAFAARLTEFDEVFSVSDHAVALASTLCGTAERTEAIATVARVLSERGLIRGRLEPCICGR
jgi:hypothetical protein